VRSTARQGENEREEVASNTVRRIEVPSSTQVGFKNGEAASSWGRRPIMHEKAGKTKEGTRGSKGSATQDRGHSQRNKAMKRM